jgi:2-polyprenyl-3-methyl-5-hydroxy-6-metoxy-1,4-benzoquinol methylase
MTTGQQRTRDTTSPPLDSDRVDAFSERVFGAILGTQQLYAIYLGDRLGWYRSLAEDGPATAPELAQRTGTAARYAREWLEQQAVCGYLEVDDSTAEPDQRRFSLPPEHAQVLAEELSVSYLTPMARALVAPGRQIDALVEAYRTGGGVSWEQQGVDAREGQAGANRPFLLLSFARDYLAAIPTVDAALRAGGKVADVGCGAGWSSIGIAQAYPTASVDGFDIDAASVELARRNAAAEGVSDRVRFTATDAADALPAAYDLVCAVECIHDMPDPVSVLSAMRRMVADCGTVLVVDERAAETFQAPGSELEQYFYGFSLVVCLPDGLSSPNSVGTGTVMRPSKLAQYAQQAGFASVEPLDLDNDFFRFYVLTPKPASDQALH